MFAKILNRPALAIVISVIIVFLGALAIKTLPMSQFPSVAPPSVIRSRCLSRRRRRRPGRFGPDHPGAVDQRRPGHAVHGLRRHQRRGGGDPDHLEPGTDPNVAVLNVNNRIATVKNRLPPIVEREGIIVMQAMTSMLMYVNVYSTEPGRRPEFPLQLRHRQHPARDQAGPGHRHGHDPRQPHVCDAGLAGSRPHAGLQRVRRRRHEGRERTEHDRLARAARPGDRQDVADRRVRPDLGGTLQQAGAVYETSS